MAEGGSSPSGVAALRPKAEAKHKVEKRAEREAQEMAEQQAMGVAELYSWDMVVHEALTAAQKVQDEEEEQIHEPEADVQTSLEA